MYYRIVPKAKKNILAYIILDEKLEYLELKMIPIFRDS